MKANLFAIFCIALFAFQAFAQTPAETDPQTAPETTETPSETPVTEPTAVPVAEEPQSDEASEASDEETAPVEQQEIAPVTSESDEVTQGTTVASEAQPEETESQEQPAAATTEETVVVTPTVPETQQEASEASEASNDEVQNEAAVPVVEDQTENTAAPVEAEPEATETTETGTAGASEETQETTTPAVPATATEENQENTDGAAESEGDAPVAASGESEDNEGAGFFAVAGKILIGVLVVAAITLVACVYNYRFQMHKYKIAPFTPPSFLPECLFPRRAAGGYNSALVSGYTELQVGNYQAAPRYAEV